MLKTKAVIGVVAAVVAAIIGVVAVVKTRLNKEDEA